jgi:TetR/AcrR family transcriptional regulator, transcriptional repressor for nem operon
MANRGPNVRGVDTRDKLLQAGVQEFHANGFSATGVDAIARSAKVPKGSFYNHFESKGAFAAEVVDCYFDRHLIKLRELLGDKERPGVERLHAYFDERIVFFKSVGARRGCLMGNFSLEIADHEEVLRQRLASHFQVWSDMFASCIRSAQRSGALRSKIAPDVLADFVLNSWEGAILRMKAERSVKPLEDARKVIFGAILL